MLAIFQDFWQLFSSLVFVFSSFFMFGAVFWQFFRVSAIFLDFLAPFSRFLAIFVKILLFFGNFFKLTKPPKRRFNTVKKGWLQAQPLLVLLSITYTFRLFRSSSRETHECEDGIYFEKWRQEDSG